MDTTETYIKMSDCPEIQGGEKSLTTHDYIGEPWVWLPRQDQLQEMIDDWWKKNGDYGQPLIKGLYDFAMSYKPQPFKEDELPLSSWEQLWLAFVMKEKYNKTWDGERWEAE